MDDALYARLSQTIRAVCLDLQLGLRPSAPPLVAWQSWARAFVAGLYHRDSAVNAALSARQEADLAELHDRAAAQIGHVAADLAWAAVRAWAGEHERAEALAHAARERFATRPGTGAVASAPAVEIGHASQVNPVSIALVGPEQSPVSALLRLGARPR